MLLGYAFFHDLLKPAAILCKALQEDEVCVVRAAEALIKAVKTIGTLKTTRLKISLQSKRSFQDLLSKIRGMCLINQ